MSIKEYLDPVNKIQKDDYPMRKRHFDWLTFAYALIAFFSLGALAGLIINFQGILTW